MQLLKYLLVVILFHALPAQAVKEIVFKKETKVYSQQNDKSEVIGIFSRGDAIPVSNEKYGGWKKVIVDSSGKKRIGWVKISEAKGSKIRERTNDEPIDPRVPYTPVYKRKTGAGFLTSLSYVYQSSGDVSISVLNQDLTAEYDSASGVNFYIGFFADFNISEKTALRTYFSLRKMERSGDAEIKTTPVTKRDFRLEQEMYALGSTLKFYENSKSQFWWGPGIEVAKSSDFKFVSDKREATDNEINVDITDDPLYVFLSLSTGYDLQIAGNFFILPEIKFGVVPNGDPLIMNFEFLIPIAYGF